MEEMDAEAGVATLTYFSLTTISWRFLVYLRWLYVPWPIAEGLWLLDDVVGACGGEEGRGE